MASRAIATMTTARTLSTMTKIKAPIVADIKRNALDDGPGIRSTVFFKGCPLGCVWCHNPECIGAAAELIHRRERCIDCRSCAAACGRGAIGAGGAAELERQRCDLCGDCADECPAGALELIDKRYEVDELVELLARDAPFYDNSGGGVTLSGGEPSLYAEYVGAVAARLRERGVHVMIETCGDFDAERFERHLLPHLDLIWCDVKLIDAAAHRRYCGRDNRRILDNIRWLSARRSPPLLLRVPLIPDITATPQNLAAIAAFVRELGHDAIGVMSYNPLWHGKAHGLGRQPAYARARALSREERARCSDALAGLRIIGAPI